MNRSIMYISAHADDIEIQAGGTLAKYQARGYETVYVMATNNMSGRIGERLADGTVRRTAVGPEPMMARRTAT